MASRQSEGSGSATPSMVICLVGVACAGAAFALSRIAGESLLLRQLFIGIALMAAAGAVTLRPRSPLGILLGGAVALVCGLAMDPSWDSARLLMWVLTAVAWLAAFLVWLPPLFAGVYLSWSEKAGYSRKYNEEARQRGERLGWLLGKGAVSLLLVLHFTGILTAIMNIPPENSPPPWLAQQVWHHYQPYLQFAYLNNAYRFYSPQPDAASLLWFRIQFKDGSITWIKMPNRGDESDPWENTGRSVEMQHGKGAREWRDRIEQGQDPLGQEYTRRLSISASIEMRRQMRAPSDPALEQIRQRRFLDETPIAREVPPDFQFRPPDELGQRLLKDLARWVASGYPTADNPMLIVHGVKIYWVRHDMLMPAEMAQPRISPTELWQFLPFYMGDYGPDGRLKDPDDPTLYWLIPIFRQEKGGELDLKRPLPSREQLVNQEYDIHPEFFIRHANRNRVIELPRQAP